MNASLNVMMAADKKMYLMVAKELIAQDELETFGTVVRYDPILGVVHTPRIPSIPKFILRALARTQPIYPKRQQGDFFTTSPTSSAPAAAIPFVKFG